MTEAAEYERLSARVTVAMRTDFFDARREVYVSGPDRQVSLESQGWLIIAGVDSNDVGAKALKAALSSPEVVMPSTPYLYNHVVSAMLECGMKEEALALIEKYWEGMLRSGADTFWEVYNPTNSLASTYGDVHINSFCDAWSCTPAYLLRSVGVDARD